MKYRLYIQLFVLSICCKKAFLTSGSVFWISELPSHKKGFSTFLLVLSWFEKDPRLPFRSKDISLGVYVTWPYNSKWKEHVKINNIFTEKDMHLLGKSLAKKYVMINFHTIGSMRVKFKSWILIHKTSSSDYNTRKVVNTYEIRDS